MIKKHPDYSTNILLTVYILSILYIVFNAFTSRFSFIDEIICIILLFYAFFNGKILYRKEFIIFSLVVIAYFIYSLIIKINTQIAVTRDFFQFMKPFFCFYAAYYGSISITENQKKHTKRLSYILAIYCYCILPFIKDLYPNTTDYYHACTFTGLLYLFSSKMRKKDFIIFTIMLFPGLASFRSKFSAEFIVYAFMLWGVKKTIKPSLNMILGISLISIVAIWANYTKFSAYFITGYDEGMARTLMYYTSFDLLKDFFPLGSGFGTFGTDASGLYYSPIYYNYGLYLIYGCTPDDYGTDSSFFMDTFYPVIIGQFGLTGIILFVTFWYKRLKEASSIAIEKYKLFIIMFMYLAIEGIASGIFLGAQTVPAMMTIGLCINLKNKNLCLT